MKSIYRIIDSQDPRHPYSLLAPDDTVVAIAERPSILVDLAFDRHGADEVRHDESLTLAASRFS